MLHDLKKNEHVKYLPEISLDKRFGYVILRQWGNTAKWVVWSFDPVLAEDYKIWNLSKSGHTEFS